MAKADKKNKTTPVKQTEAEKAKAPVRTKKPTQVWMDIKAVPFSLGRICIELYPDCPLAFENFRALCTGEITDPATGQKMSYAGSLIDEIHDDYIIGGEITDNIDEVDPTDMIDSDLEGDSLSQDEDSDDDAKTSKKKHKKTGSDDDEFDSTPLKTGEQAVSIYGGYFKNEEAGLERRHTKIGTVSMFSEKFNRNGSKFLITLKPNMKWLDGQYVVIGKVVKGMKSLFNLQEYRDTTCLIEDCGRLRKVGLEKVNPILAEVLEEMQSASSSSSSPETEKSKTKTTTPTTTTTTEGAKDGEQAKVLCPSCGTHSKYVKRVIGTGVRYKCRNKECLNAFWVKDNKVTEEIAQRVLALQKQQRQLAHQEQLELARLEREKKQALKKQRKAKRNSGDNDNDNDGDDNSETLPNSLAMKADIDISTLPPAALAGSHQIKRVLDSMSTVQKIREEANQRYLQSLEDHRQFVKAKRRERGEVVSDSEDEDEDDEESDFDYSIATPVIGRQAAKKMIGEKPTREFSKGAPIRENNSFNRNKSTTHDSRTVASNPNKKRPRHEVRMGIAADGDDTNTSSEITSPKPKKPYERHGAGGKSFDNRDTKRGSMSNTTSHTRSAPFNKGKPRDGLTQSPAVKKDKTRWRDRDAQAVPQWFAEKQKAKSTSD